MRRAAALAVILAFVSGMAALAARAGSDAAPDPLAVEIDRWAAFLRTNTSTGETWKQLKEGVEPLMGGAQSALADGRRLLALQRLLTARAGLASAAYMQATPAAQVKDVAAFEAEWARMGDVLRDGRAAPRASALDAVRQYGLFYLGSARAAVEASELCRSLSQPAGDPPPPVRSLRGEIETLEGELLAAYRPPLSVDRHPDFIAASSLLKEARDHR
jgi:hypothetical protein